jgi:hypothetical protein
LRLDGNATFPLNVHAVKVLGAHRPIVYDPGELQHSISKGGFSVVNVRDDAEISDSCRICLGRLKPNVCSWRQRKSLGLWWREKCSLNSATSNLENLLFEMALPVRLERR